MDTQTGLFDGCGRAEERTPNPAMIYVKNQKGYHLRLAGSPAAELVALDSPLHVAVLPEHIPFVKPRLKVKLGDSVQVGTPLFEDKRNPEVHFLSPAGGSVSDIRYGHRRVIEQIVIQRDPSESFQEFEAVPEKALDAMQPDQLIEILLKGGMWALLRQLPFRDYPQPGSAPPAVYVTIGNLQPFHPRPNAFLRGNEALFRYGIKILQKLAQGSISIAAHHDDFQTISAFSDLVTHVYSGNYPAHDAGVLVYRTRKDAGHNRAWYIDGQDLLLMAELVKTGKYPTEKIVAIAGSLAAEKKHFKIRMGSPVRHLLNGHPAEGSPRYIAGGVFSGYPIDEDGYLGPFESSLTVLPDGRGQEVLALFRPGYHKPSYSRAFLSALNTHDFQMDCNRHGGIRACIGCNHCTEVCPVEILPQLTYKGILADALEEVLAHGLLDCVECGLCSYVCPSKIELFLTLKNAKAAYYREQVR